MTDGGVAGASLTGVFSGGKTAEVPACSRASSNVSTCRRSSRSPAQAVSKNAARSLGGCSRADSKISSTFFQRSGVIRRCILTKFDRKRRDHKQSAELDGYYIDSQ